MNDRPTPEQIPDRLVCPTCPICGKGFAQKARGRLRKWCSDSCKQEAHVRRRIDRTIAGGSEGQSDE